MQRFFPFLQWIPNYRGRDFPKDLIAAFTVAIVLIPQAMAYAMIVGLPPVYGLYASVVPLLAYGLFGTSKHLAIGPVAMDSLLVAAGLGTLAIVGEENYLMMVVLLTLLTGVMQLLLGVFKMGFLVNFLSKPVISGFISAAALIIIFTQLKHLFGVDIERSNLFHQILKNAFDKISQISWVDFLMGVSGILLLIGFKKWNKRIPAILITVVLTILITYFFHLEAKGIKIVGSIPLGLPHFQAPVLDFSVFKSLWPIALTLALIGYLEAISIGKRLEEKNNEHRIDANQELVALGASNITGSFFQSFPVTASFSRSAINDEAGVRTNLSGILTGFIVLVTLLFLTPLFYFLPKAVLGAIIMVSVFGLIDFKYPQSLWKHQKDELAVLLCTFLITLFVGITQGILAGVLFSLLLMVYRTSKPHFAVLGKIADSEYYKNVDRFEDDVLVRDDLLILRFDAQLYFGNTNYFKKQVYKLIAKKGDRLKGIILNAEAINYIDSSATNMLIGLIEDMKKKGIAFYIAGAIGPTRDIIFRSGIVNVLQKEHLFVRTTEAVAYFDNPEEVSELASKVAYQNRKKG